MSVTTHYVIHLVDLALSEKSDAWYKKHKCTIVYEHV